MEVKRNGKNEKYMEDKAFIEWLQSIQKPTYQRNCSDSFVTFLDFLRESEKWENPTGTDVIARHYENRKSDDKKVKFYFDDLMPKFVDWLTENKGLSHNSAISITGQVRGFFTFHREPLKIQKGKPKQIEKAKNYHAFTRDELSKMVRVANLEEKAIILLGKDEGIRAGDFVSQKREPIIQAYKNSHGNFTLEFEVDTEKEGVVAVVHVMEETWIALNDYWVKAPSSEWIFSEDGKTHISEDRANDVLKNTWKIAYPDRQDVKVRFHELRSFKMTALSNVGVNEWHIKRMVGKKLSQDILTYLRGINLKEDFVKAEKEFRFTGIFTGSNHDLLDQLKETVSDLQKKDSQKTTVIESLVSENLKLHKELEKATEDRIKDANQLKEETANLIIGLAKSVKEKNISLSDALYLLIKESKELRQWNPEKEPKPLIEILKEKIEANK